MLSGAVNTAIIGSNGVLNRVAEDGVMTDWFREPHKKMVTSAGGPGVMGKDSHLSAGRKLGSNGRQNTTISLPK